MKHCYSTYDMEDPEENNCSIPEPLKVFVAQAASGVIVCISDDDAVAEKFAQDYIDDGHEAEVTILGITLDERADIKLNIINSVKKDFMNDFLSQPNSDPQN